MGNDRVQKAQQKLENQKRKENAEGKEELVQVEHILKHHKLVIFKFDHNPCYDEFLKVVRDSVSNGISSGIRITFAKQSIILDSHILDLQLHNDAGDSIIVRIVCYEVYVIGFRSEVLKEWFCVNNDDYLVFFPQGTTLLSFGKSYSKLGGLYNSNYGHSSFNEAVKGLNHATCDEHRKPHFKNLLVMIAEAARLHSIGKNTGSLIKRYEDDKIKGKYYDMIHGWDKASKNFVYGNVMARRQGVVTTLRDREVENDVIGWSNEIIIDSDSTYTLSPLDKDDDHLDFEEDAEVYTKISRVWVDLESTDNRKQEKWDIWRKKQPLKLVCSSSMDEVIEDMKVKEIKSEALKAKARSSRRKKGWWNNLKQ